MKQKTALIAFGAGALALVAYYFTSLKKTVTNLSVSVFGIKYNSERTVNSAFLKVWFDLKLKVNNPTQRSVTVNEVLLDFYLNNKKAGEVRSFQKIKINPVTDSILVVPTYFNTLIVFPLISSFLEAIKNNEPIGVTVKGTVNVEGNIVKLDEKITLDVKPLVETYQTFFKKN